MIQRLMAESLALKTGQIDRIAARASHSYYHFRIPKKNGELRDIFHPSQDLKLLQRWLVRRLFLSLPLSRAATAYEEGCSINRNARQHVGNRFLLRLDFSDFFPSLRAQDITQVLTRNAELVKDVIEDTADIAIVSRIVCRFGSLTIGAPSSPSLSNRLMEPFDAFCLASANAQGVTYTRYADDLFFSCSEPNVLQRFPRIVADHIQIMDTPRLRLNDAKTSNASKKGRRVITGLRLTSDNRISLGRNFKRPAHEGTLGAPKRPE